MTLAMLALVLAAPFPDAIDALRVGGAKPRLSLLLDSSGSMRWGAQPTVCTWFASAHHGGSARLNKLRQMQAVLVGCQSPDDGILARWHEEVEFGLFDFGGQRAPFGASLAELSAAALAVPARGATPLTATLRTGGAALDGHSTGANTEVCTPFFQLLLSDGNPNGGAATFEQACVAPPVTKAVGAMQPHEGSAYLFSEHPDLICSVEGDQVIRTFTLGFGLPGDFNPVFLRRVAEEGGGAYHPATTVPELIAAFDSIMGSVSSAGQPAATVTVGRDRYFSGNRVYAAGFEPVVQGPWKGNLRRFCLLPPRDGRGLFQTSERGCVFASPDGTELVTNPGVVDVWSGASLGPVDRGGAAERIQQLLGGAPSPPYWSKREVRTWRTGQAGWVQVQPDTWLDADAHVGGCERRKLINFLHGYTRDANCGTGAPRAVRDVALGAPVHAAPLELQYGSCDTPGGCLVLLPTNDGMLSVVDAATGEEKLALVPPELWRPGTVARSSLAQIAEQPSVRHLHRYYLDATPTLAHLDLDGDGFIDPEEPAVVFLSLGRGGRAVHALDVSKLGGANISNLSVRSILPVPGTPFARLADTWAAPEAFRLASGRRVAALVTGHEPQFDVIERRETPVGGFGLEDGETVTRTIPCAEVAAASGYLGAGFCEELATVGCLGTADDPCYDGALIPLDDAAGPISIPHDRPAAMRFRFARFDLGPGDVLRVEDDRGHVFHTYTGQGLDGQWSDWIHAPAIVLRRLTDGVDGPHEGVSIDEIEYQPGIPFGRDDPSTEPAPRLGVDHRPALLLVDLDAIGAAPPFGTVDSDAVHLTVARDCGGGPRCLDRTSAPDLEDFVCPVSAPPAPYVRDGRAERFYLGDECGQIFEIAWAEDRWSARRVLRLNDGPPAVDPDHRKLAARIEVVESICPGRDAVGLYFGTGDPQRPLSTDSLGDSAITDGREVAGVVWVPRSGPSDASLSDLADATDVADIDPVAAFAEGKKGWVLRLPRHERVLRDPVVLEGVMYARTFAPAIDPSACAAGSGIDRIYAVDNCTAEAVDPGGQPADRVVFEAPARFPADLLVVAPPGGAPFVSHGDLSAERPAVLGRPRSTRPGVYFWRELP